MSVLRRLVFQSTLTLLAVAPAAAEVRIGGNVFINGQRVAPGVYRPGGPAPRTFPTVPHGRRAARPFESRVQHAERPSRPATTFVQAPRRRPSAPRAAPGDLIPEIIDIS